jgi:hypothetical protein
MSIKVSVTEKHIADGQCEDANFCAFALAVNDALMAAGIPASYVRIGMFGETDEGDPYAGWNASARLDGGWLTAPLTRDVIDWIYAFDQEKPVQPFDVELTWEDE